MLVLHITQFHIALVQQKLRQLAISCQCVLVCVGGQAAGYRIIEVNAATSRTGAAVLNLVGEATQSQRVNTAVLEGNLQGGLCARPAAAALMPLPPPPEPLRPRSGSKASAAGNRGSKASATAKKPHPAPADKQQPKIASIFGAAHRNHHCPHLYSLTHHQPFILLGDYTVVACGHNSSSCERSL